MLLHEYKMNGTKTESLYCKHRKCCESQKVNFFEHKLMTLFEVPDVIHGSTDV